PTPQQTATATITPFTLPISAITAHGRLYATNSPYTTLFRSVSANFFASDSDGTTLNVSAVVGTFSDKHQGANKTVTISGLTLDSNSFGDYAHPSPQQTTTATITPLTLTVSGITASDRRYDNN